MNIFYLDENPEIAATYHADKHVVKMILETAQLLSTAHRVLDGQMVIERDAANRRIKRWKFSDEREEILYKSTHVNHPSAIWVRASREHYEWTYRLFKALLAEYTYRYGKVHASTKLLQELAIYPQNALNKGFVPPPAAMDDEFIRSTNRVENYRTYYIEGKSDLLQYTKREKPPWLGD